MFQKIDSHHHKPRLVDVLRLPVGVLKLFAEDEVKLEEEDVTVLRFPDQLLRVPDLKAVLEDDLAEGVVGKVAAVQHGEVQSVVGLLGHVQADFEAFFDLTLILN